MKAVTKEWSKENLSPWQREEEKKKKKDKIVTSVQTVLKESFTNHG